MSGASKSFGYFDLETTSSGRNSKIIHIGAVHADGQTFFRDGTTTIHFFLYF